MEIIHGIFGWIHTHPIIMTLTGVASILMSIGTVVGLPVLMVRVPKDYFLKERNDPLHRNKLIHYASKIAKNILGGICIIVGLAMLVLPGPGFLTIFIGIIFTDFPGKRKVEIWIISRKLVIKTINSMRCKRGFPPLLIPTKINEQR